jgi:hypothetical protein
VLALLLVGLLSVGGLLIAGPTVAVRDQPSAGSPQAPEPATSSSEDSTSNSSAPATVPATDSPSADIAAAGPAGKPLAPVGAAPHVTAIGDSVVLGAAPELARALGPIEVDAAVGRQSAAAIEVLRARKMAGTLAPVVVVHVGNNGALSRSQLDEMMQVLLDFPTVLLVNLHVPRPWEGPNNALLAEAADRYPNVVLVDWAAASASRPELFADDQGHLTRVGAITYADIIARQLRMLGVVTSSSAVD